MVHLKEKPNIPNLATMLLVRKQHGIFIKVALFVWESASILRQRNSIGKHIL
jgi:hypothetical protein